jgi:peptidoglycan hydrolase-like amidase
MGPLPGDAWLPYFRGGTTPWSARRALGQVRALVGDVQTLSGEGQQIQVTSAEGTTTQPCEPLRSALRLPGCPRSVEFEGQSVVFRGMGQGHGLGLDVDAAARSNLDARTLLERAYGLHLSD